MWIYLFSSVGEIVNSLEIKKKRLSTQSCVFVNDSSGASLQVKIIVVCFHTTILNRLTASTSSGIV